MKYRTEPAFVRFCRLQASPARAHLRRFSIAPACFRAGPRDEVQPYDIYGSRLIKKKGTRLSFLLLRNRFYGSHIGTKEANKYIFTYVDGRAERTMLKSRYI
jgi:hypothetical protein